MASNVSGPLSVAMMFEEARRLRAVGQRQLKDVVDLLDDRLQQVIANYEEACDGVPRLQIESEIAKARLLIGELRAVASALKPTKD